LHPARGLVEHGHEILPGAVRPNGGAGDERCGAAVPAEKSVLSAHHIDGELLATAAGALGDDGCAVLLRDRAVDPGLEGKRPRASEVESPRVRNSDDIIAAVAVAGEAGRAIV